MPDEPTGDRRLPPAPSAPAADSPVAESSAPDSSPPEPPAQPAGTDPSPEPADTEPAGTEPAGTEPAETVQLPEPVPGRSSPDPTGTKPLTDPLPALTTAELLTQPTVTDTTIPEPAIQAAVAEEPSVDAPTTESTVPAPLGTEPSVPGTTLPEPLATVEPPAADPDVALPAATDSAATRAAEPADEPAEITPTSADDLATGPPVTDPADEPAETGATSAEDPTDDPIAGPIAGEASVTGATGAEPVVTEPTDAEPTDAEPTDAEPTGAEPTDAEPTDAEPTDAEPVVADSPADGVAPVEGDRLRTRIAERYAPGVALYQLLESRLRETSPAGPGSPVGWTPYLQALRALRDGNVAGHWEDLARLMVDPAALAPGAEPREADRRAVVEAAVRTPHALLVQAPRGPERTAVIAGIIERLAADEARILLMAPADAVDAVMESLGGESEILAVRADPEPAARTGSGAEPGSGPEPGSKAGPGKENLPYAGTIRTAGTAHLRAWKGELRRLQRELMWLEQWPRDRAALAAAQAEQDRLSAASEARVAEGEAEVGERQAKVTAAGQAIAAAQAEHDRLAEVHRRAAAEAMVLRAEHAGLQEAADAAAQVADERGRAAAEERARCTALEERIGACRQELQAARDREASLMDELTRAKESLPQSAAEAERLYAAEADAAADAHMSYYRLAAAESARAAKKRGASLSQRMRPTAEQQQLRRQVSDLKREADEAATRARQAKQALEQAEEQHARLAAFVSNGGTELMTLRETQERLAEQVVQLTEELETVQAGLDEHLRTAAEAAEQAEQAAAAAHNARELGLRGEERLTDARLAEERAAKAVEQARQEERAAARRLTESQERLELLREREAAALAEQVELQEVADSELGSRGHVRDICGEDPATAPEEVLTAHRDRAMSRIEQLSGYLRLAQERPPGDEADPADAEFTELLLGTATLACGSPLDIAAGPLARIDAFDVLIVDDADQVTDGEFLPGAVRARRWILAGDPRGLPEPAASHRDRDHLRALAVLHRLDHDAGRPDGAVGDDDLDGAVETVSARWEEDEPARLAAVRAEAERLRRLAAVRAEAERLRDGGLWEARYRDAYGRALRRSRPPGGTDEEAERDLSAVLHPGLFVRAAAAGPCLRLLPAQHP
ncbi:hypothetical protein ACRYCC_16085 [Actinomadura scrupuli]|uniref:hypothetical protein n=1 Tax=Actinomadura scrupuli TaxID=559629 RepID=UPI003D95F0F3